MIVGSRSASLLQDDPNLPDDFGPRLTSQRLRYVRWAFALLVLVALVGLLLVFVL